MMIAKRRFKCETDKSYFLSVVVDDTTDVSKLIKMVLVYRCEIYGIIHELLEFI